MKNHLKIGIIIFGHSYMPGDFYNTKQKNYNIGDPKMRPGVILMHYGDFFLVQWFCSSGKNLIQTKINGKPYSYDIGNLTCWIHYSKIKQQRYIIDSVVIQTINKNYQELITKIFKQLPRRKKIKKLIAQGKFQKFSLAKQKRWLAIKQFTNTERMNSFKKPNNCIDKIQYLAQRDANNDPVKKWSLKKREAQHIYDFKTKIITSKKRKGKTK